MAEPQLTVVDVPARHRYELRLDGKPAGFVTYRNEPGVLVLLHTEIDDAYEGHGLGSVLAEHVLDAARSAGLRVRPDCPFIRSYVEEHPEFADLVTPGDR